MSAAQKDPKAEALTLRSTVPNEESPLRVLQRDDALFHTLLEAVGDALFVVDKDRNIVHWNRQAENLTGVSEQGALGKYCLAAIRCEKCLYHCELFEKGEVRGVEVTLIGANDRKLHCVKDAFLLRDPTGEVVGGVEILKDMTELVEQVAASQQQQSKIEQRERLNQAILLSMREGLITIDDQKRITSFSRRAEEMTGHSASWAIGRPCSEVIGSPLCGSDCPAEFCASSNEDEAERLTELTTASGVRLPIVSVAAPLRTTKGEAAGTVLLIEDRSQQQTLRRVAEGVVFAGMIGRSRAMQQVFQVIEQVAPSDATVLIAGESGTGKEMVARAIHLLSGRAPGPFQAINSAALPDTLLESELFGHARGSFTGAMRDRPGRIEEAENGTLFLDEIGEISLPLQAKLLRFLQEREYTRVGENIARKSNARIVAATNRDLQAEVREGRFREDLLYRIRVIPIQLPPLRERARGHPAACHRVAGEDGTASRTSGTALDLGLHGAALSIRLAGERAGADQCDRVRRDASQTQCHSRG
jgi:PAS domain S-box-containing protein